MLRRRPSNASEKEQTQKKKLSLQRSSSFKDFMKNKPTSPVLEKELSLEENVVGAGTPEDIMKSGSKLGKKWRNVISRTMTRKTSKMVQKALAEEGSDSSDELSPVSSDMIPDLSSGQRASMCSIGSEDTTSSPITRQLSGSSDRQSLDSGYSQRDSMRLEDSSYSGPFCGRALVHTDFTPSPYDVESLKLQKGDIIYIIEKPPVGTWTGKLNNKVGSFKFIYVNLLPDESPPARKRHRNSRSCQDKSKPKTLEEVLDTMGLSDLTSLLFMHGFQNLEDFAGLKESHLNELNITDPEQRSKILNASELLRDSEDETESVKEDESRDSEHPRDSGCFESSENLESCREEANKEEQEEEKEEQEEEKEEQEEGKEEQEEEKEEHVEEKEEQEEGKEEQEEGKEEQEEEKEEQEEGKEEQGEEKEEQEEEKEEQEEEKEEQGEERHPQEVEQRPEMDAVQEQLTELTLDEGC